MSLAKGLGHWSILRLKFFTGVALFLLAFVGPLAAQEPQERTLPKIEAKVILGGANFDEDIPHGLVGGALRFYVTKRLSIEPEYLYLRHSENDQDQIFQPNVAYDFTDPTKRFVVYGIAGAGVLRHKGRFFGNDFDTGAPVVFETSFTTWTASVGGGVKIFATKRFFIAPEVRVGREPNVRGTISVGYVLAGKD